MFKSFAIPERNTERKYSTSTTKFVFYRTISQQNGSHCLWLAETFLTSTMESLNRFWRNLTESKYSASSIKSFFFFFFFFFFFCRPVKKMAHAWHSCACYWVIWASCLMDLVILSHFLAINVYFAVEKSKMLNLHHFSKFFMFWVKQWPIIPRCTIKGPLSPLVSVLYMY